MDHVLGLSISQGVMTKINHMHQEEEEEMSHACTNNSQMQKPQPEMNPSMLLSLNTRPQALGASENIELSQFLQALGAEIWVCILKHP